MKDQVSYYAVIPANVRYDENIPPNAKLLYGEITALCNKEGFCWASNRYFAELYKVKPATVSEWVRLLCKGGYVRYTIKNKTQRQIFIVNLSEKADGGIGKNRKEVSEKAEHNITVNTTRNGVGDADVPFVWNEYLKTMDEDPRMHIQLLSHFFRMRKMKADSKDEASAFISRHTKAASRVVKFGKSKVLAAFNRCVLMEKDGIDWTLETVYKVLTK